MQALLEGIYWGFGSGMGALLGKYMLKKRPLFFV